MCEKISCIFETRVVVQRIHGEKPSAAAATSHTNKKMLITTNVLIILTLLRKIMYRPNVQSGGGHFSIFVAQNTFIFDGSFQFRHLASAIMIYICSCELKRFTNGVSSGWTRWRDVFNTIYVERLRRANANECCQRNLFEFHLLTVLWTWPWVWWGQRNHTFASRRRKTVQPSLFIILMCLNINHKSCVNLEQSFGIDNIIWTRSSW